MSVFDLRGAIENEVETILSREFEIEVQETGVVPHSSDPEITFPNLDERRQGTKFINTCVLYIDIRRSTELNLRHRATTVAKLYTAFVRAMTRCARYHKGHVRGIIGDRVMVIFDSKDAFANAVGCAIAMNSAAKHVINRHFKHGEVACGIGIDAGRMLVTKTGVRRRGHEQGSYRNLVWLGRPANVASKLTDLANKQKEEVALPILYTGHRAVGSALASLLNMTWYRWAPSDVLRKLGWDPNSGTLRHFLGVMDDMRVVEENVIVRSATPNILMTEAVWNGFRTACPNHPSVGNRWFKPIPLAVPGYGGRVFGGDVIYTAFRSEA